MGLYSSGLVYLLSYLAPGGIRGVCVCMCVRERPITNAHTLPSWTITSVYYGSAWTKEVCGGFLQKLKLQHFAVTSDILIWTLEKFYFIF